MKAALSQYERKAGESTRLMFPTGEQGYGLSTVVEADAAVKITYVYKIESLRLSNTHAMGKNKRQNCYQQHQERSTTHAEQTPNCFFLHCMALEKVKSAAIKPKHSQSHPYNGF